MLRWSAVRSNDSEFLLQEHNADPEREPPGECCRTPKAYPASSKFLLGTPPRAEPLDSFEAHPSQASFDPA